MTPPPLLLSTLLIGGILTLLGYVYFLPRVSPTQPVSALWFGIQGPVRTVYYVSIVLAAIAFLVMSGWMLFRPSSNHSSERRVQETRGLSVFFAGAILWSVTLWIWGQVSGANHTHSGSRTVARGIAELAVMMALILTTVGALLLLLEWTNRGLNNGGHAPWWVVVAAGYVLFHVGVLDNIGWGVAFLCRA